MEQAQWATGRRTGRVTAARLVTGFFLLSLSGCSVWDSVASVWTLESQTERVVLTATPDVNRGFPIAVDLVGVVEPEFVAVMAELPAQTWFTQRADFIASNPAVLEVRSFELVPGQTIDDIEYGWSDRRNLDEIFIFAAYVTEGPHRGRLGSFATPTVVLGAETLFIQPGDE